MIGDSLSDIEAGTRLGMATIFVPGDPTTRKAGSEHAVRLASAIAASLTDAVDRYLLAADISSQ